MHYSKTWFIKSYSNVASSSVKNMCSNVVSSSVKNMCIRFVTVRRILKKECVCHKLQRSLRYLWVNSVQVTPEGASSFVDMGGTLG